MKIAVHSLPSIKIDGKGSVHINETLKKMVEQIEVRLFGDFVLREQPTTYEESVKIFKELPTHLGTEPDFERAAAMQMHLSPITRFCDDKTWILLSISNNLLQTITGI